MDNRLARLYEFGNFRLDVTERQLLSNGIPVQLKPKAFDTLLLLVENSGHLIEKDELMRQIWPDTFVEDVTLARNIADLRKALGETASERKYIDTIPKRGYRFIATVEELFGEDEEDLVIEKTTFSRMVINQDETITNELIITPAISIEPVTKQIPQTIALEEPKKSRVAREFSRPFVILITFLITGIVATVFYYFYLNRQSQTNSTLNIRSIAVLPFKSLNAEDKDPSFGIGMTDALITKLSGTGQITVRPTSAVIKYNKQDQDPLSAGREQSVDALLDGRVQRAGDYIKVTVQLVRVSDGASLWAETFNEKFTNLFTVQDSISEQVARALTLKLTGEQRKQLTKRYTDNIAAYQLYINGRYHWNKRNEEGLKKSIEYFNQAIETDPNYALAYAGLADSYLVLGTQEATLGGIAPEDAFPRARAAAAKALEMDDTLVEAHTALAVANCHLGEGRCSTGLRNAIDINPNYAMAHNYLAITYMANGRSDEAMAEIRRAQELDPLSLIINTNIGMVYYRSRRHDEAIKQLKKTLDMDADFLRAKWFLGLSFEAKGMMAEAIAEFQRLVEISHRRPLALASLGHAYAISGERGKAMEIIEELKQNAEKQYVSCYHIALIYAGLGDKDQAFAWLEKSFNAQESSLGLLKVEQRLDPLRNDPRFVELMNR